MYGDRAYTERGITSGRWMFENRPCCECVTPQNKTLTIKLGKVDKRSRTVQFSFSFSRALSLFLSRNIPLSKCVSLPLITINAAQLIDDTRNTTGIRSTMSTRKPAKFKRVKWIEADSRFKTANVRVHDFSGTQNIPTRLFRPTLPFQINQSIAQNYIVT